MSGSGWKLSGALLAKQFGKLGESLSEALANFDPETATQVDREALQGRLREAAMKLAGSRINMAREQKEADDLRAQIVRDTAASQILIKKFNEGKLDEATLSGFADELEASKARLPQEDQEALDAKEIVTTMEEVLSTLQSMIDQFDRKASDIRRQLALAEAQKDRESLRLQNQADITALRTGLSNSSSALNALSKRTEKVKVEAAGDKILADAGQVPLDRQKAVDEARKIAGGQDHSGESAVERLTRLSQPAANQIAE